MKPTHADTYFMGPITEETLKNLSESRFYSEIPSFRYNPQPKPPSRRDLIRLGVFKRNGEAGKNYSKFMEQLAEKNRRG